MVNGNSPASGSGPAAASVGGYGSGSGWIPVDGLGGRYFVRRDGTGRIVETADYPEDVMPSPAASAPRQEPIPFLERVRMQMGRVPSMVPKTEGVYEGDDIRRAGGPDTGAEDVRLKKFPITQKEIDELGPPD